MTRSVTLYGFGSAFAEIGGANARANDLDLLIVHSGTDAASCQFAISCKRRLTKSVVRAHISMLADSEEAALQFIKAAQAVRLGAIREEYFDNDLKTLVTVLPQLGM